MIKQFTLTSLLFLTIPIILSGQTRYLDSLFISTVSQSDAVYGQAPALSFPYLFETSTYNQDLLMDVYTPQGDVQTDRPCIVFAHGGAFALGSKTDVPVVQFCEQMANKGYVVVSIEYRLGFNLTNTASAERAVYRGIQDMKTAIRYVKENAVSLGIDSSKVFAGGNSAGGVMALNAAYLDESERMTLSSLSSTPDLGCLNCSGNTLTHGDVPLAIANLWGGISDISFINANNPVPIIAFHGTNDNTVSPDSAHPFNYNVFPTLEGSNIIINKVTSLGFTNDYHKFYGEGHEPWGASGGTPQLDTIVNKTAQFFYQFLTPSVSTNQIKKSLSFEAFPNPVLDQLTVRFPNNDNNNYSILITNALGQVVFNQQYSNHFSNTFTIPFQELPKGWYNISIDNEGVRASKTIIKL